MASNYTIGVQEQTTEIGPTGRNFINVWEVPVKVLSGPAKGTNFTLTFPDDEHTADVVKSAIEAKIANLESVASLGNG